MLIEVHVRKRARAIEREIYVIRWRKKPEYTGQGQGKAIQALPYWCPGECRELTHERYACVEHSKTEGMKQRAGHCYKGHVSWGPV
eukprot:364818-Chlamydomonas_euryale.AAC.33